MDLKNICLILNQRLNFDVRQGIFYFKIQNGGEYLWFDDSYLGTKLYFEINFVDPQYVLSVGPRSGDKESSNYREFDELVRQCQTLIDHINI